MEGFNIPGIEIVTGSNIQCGVNVKVSEGIIGDWTLIAREIRNSERIERHLPFKIYVEGIGLELFQYLLYTILPYNILDTCIRSRIEDKINLHINNDR